MAWNKMCLARLDICADLINQGYHDYTLLDVGCRTMDLKPLLSGCHKYHGTDLIAGDGVMQCDLEKDLPFEDDEYDIVVALDVLEHLNNPHGALDELCRVARKAVFVSLPNMYYIEFRLRFLRGGGVSGKYQFPSTPILDRHRWLLSYSEALNFIKQNSGENTVTHKMILPVRGRTKSIVGPIEKWLAHKMPNLFAYGVFFEIKLTQ